MTKKRITIKDISKPSPRLTELRKEDFKPLPAPFDEPESTPESGAPVRRVMRMGRGKGYGIMLGGLSGDVLEVLGVEQGLAAAEAGLRRGDRIIAMNGKPVESLSIDERNRLFRGSPLVLKVDREGRIIEITMSLD